MIQTMKVVLAALLTVQALGTAVATPDGVCAKLAQRRYLVLDVRTAEEYAAGNVCGGDNGETQNVPAASLTAENVEETLLALTWSAQTTGWGPIGQRLGVSKDKERTAKIYSDSGAETDEDGATYDEYKTTGTAILVYGDDSGNSATVTTLITNAGWLGALEDIGDYTNVAAANCACAPSVCDQLADPNAAILDTRKDTVGGGVLGYSTTNRLCPRTVNYPRTNAWTDEQLETYFPDKNAKILTLCWRGNWAESGRLDLEARGYTNVDNIGGWQFLAQLKCAQDGNGAWIDNSVVCPSGEGGDPQTFELTPCADTHPPNSDGVCTEEEDGGILDDLGLTDSSASRNGVVMALLVTLAYFL